MNFAPEGSRFRLFDQDFEIAMCGQMNIRNAAMAASAALQFGISLSESAAALQRFRGVRKRQEEELIGDCSLVQDKASHPRALTELVSALRQRFPGHRLVSVIQPRATGGSGWIYQRELPEALSGFDQVILTSAREHNPSPTRNWSGTPFCLQSLAFALEGKGMSVVVAQSDSELRAALQTTIRAEDVVLLTVLEQSEDLVRVVASSLGESPSHPSFASAEAMLPAA